MAGKKAYSWLARTYARTHERGGSLKRVPVALVEVFRMVR